MLRVRRQCSPGSMRFGRVAHHQPVPSWQRWLSSEHSAAHAGQSASTAQQRDSNPGPFHTDWEIRSPSDSYRAPPVISRRIHVLGVGNVGRFIAHSLRGTLNPPPVTLIFCHWTNWQRWKKSSKSIELVTEGNSEFREGFEAELSMRPPRSHGQTIDVELPHEQSDEPIHSLIVCTKTIGVVTSLLPLKHRLHKSSTILFLQNGIGYVEEVNKEVFPDPETRPHYMLGVNSHGLSGHGDGFATTHAGFGTISLSSLPHERDRATAPYEPKPRFGPGPGNAQPIQVEHPPIPVPGTEPPSSTYGNWTSTQRFLLRTLLRIPVLCASGFAPQNFLQFQLEKLAINCIINPLTVLLDARNGSILYNYSLTRTMRLLLAEISQVILSLPELQYIPNVDTRFDPGRLETLVVGVAYKTRNNISSMLADVRRGRKTEIDYINGWIVRKGEEHGLQCLANYMMVHLIKGKGAMVQSEYIDDVPVVERKQDGAIVFNESIVAGADVNVDAGVDSIRKSAE